MADTSVNLLNSVAPQFKPADRLSDTSVYKKDTTYSSDGQRKIKDTEDQSSQSDIRDTQMSRKTEFEEILEAQITLREQLRELEKATDQRPDDSLNVSFNTTILEGTEGTDQGLSFMPTVEEFTETFTALTDVQETVEIPDSDSTVDLEEGIAFVTEKTSEVKEGPYIKESEQVDPKLVKQRGTETLSGGETDDNLKVKDAKDKKDVKPVASAEDFKNADLKKAEDVVKLAKELGDAKNPESEKLAKQLKLSESSGDVKIKVTNTEDTHTSGVKNTEDTNTKKLLEIQELEAEQRASEDSDNTLKLVKKTDISGQKAQASKLDLPLKGTGSGPDMASGSLKPSVLTENTSPQGQINQPQAGFKAEGTQVPVYTSTQQSALVSQVSQGMAAAKQEGLTKFFIQMNPPQLGKVLVEIQMKGGQVKALFSSNKETLSLLKEDSDTLRDSLKELGVDSESEFEFNLLSDEGKSHEFFENSPQTSSSNVYQTSMDDGSDQLLDLRGLQLDRDQVFHEVA